jgi:hypothetical protein
VSSSWWLWKYFRALLGHDGDLAGRLFVGDDGGLAGPEKPSTSPRTVAMLMSFGDMSMTVTS